MTRMNPSFTPRASVPEASPEVPVKPVKKPQASPSLRKLWRLIIVATLQRTKHLLARIAQLIRRYITRLTPRQRLLHVAGILGIALIFALLPFILPHRPVATETTPDTVASGAPLPKENPTFSTMLPSGKTAEELGGWRRVSPSDRNPVYAFPDEVAGVPIIVSEQPIPDNFKSDLTGSIQKLSDGYSAGRTFDANGITVHIGKSAKGPQSLIFTTRGLLVLIKSASTVTDDKWVTYITSLQ